MKTQDLKQLLRDRGLTQAQSGISEAMVYLIVSGRRLPGPRALTRLAERLGLPPTQVMAACKAHQKPRRPARQGA